MARVLIAGCGYVGLATARLFQARGWEVEGWTASDDSAAKLKDEPFPVVGVNLAEAAAVHARGGMFDAMIHCAASGGGGPEAYRAVYRGSACHLLDAFPQAPLLFTSSTSVYAQKNGEWVTEESAAQPTRETGQILRETEEIVLAAGGIVARLAGIYGPGRSFLLQKFLAGDAIIDPARDHFVNQAHRDDIAAALVLLIEQRHSLRAPRIFNIADDTPILQSDCYRWLAEKLQRPQPPTGETAAPRKRGDSDKRVANAKLRQLGWEPRFPDFPTSMTQSILPSFGVRLP